MTEEDDIARWLAAGLKKARPYASFFDWPNKETKELGVVRQLLESMGDSGPLRLREVRPGRPDPPDAVGTQEDGTLAAVEVTELVDPEAIRRNVSAARNSRSSDPIEQMKDRVVRIWDRPDLISAVEERLRAKDEVTLMGGPFERYVVVLHTDEPMLSVTDAQRWLAAHTFAGMSQITDAFLLMSYDPTTDGYPIISLGVSR